MTQPPSKILHWCGVCRGEQIHQLSRELHRGAQPVTLYSCLACGAAPVEISEPERKAVSAVTAARALEAQQREAFKLEVDRPRGRPSTRPQTETPTKTQRRETMPKSETTKKLPLLDRITEIVDSRIRELVPEAVTIEGVRDIVRTELEAALGLSSDGAPSRPARRAPRAAQLADSESEDFTCPRGRHNGKCPSKWCLKAAGKA